MLEISLAPQAFCVSLHLQDARASWVLAWVERQARMLAAQRAEARAPLVRLAAERLARAQQELWKLQVWELAQAVIAF